MNTPEPLEGMSEKELLALRERARRSLNNPLIQPWEEFFDYKSTIMLICFIDEKLHGSQTLR
jgi:hypothetical protein